MTVRMSDEELRMLQELAEADGVSVSDFVRIDIRKQHRARFGEQPAKKPKR